MLQAQVNYWTLQENKRHNVETEHLGWSTLDETIRHNVRTENETERHNRATEALGWEDVNVKYANLGEQRRHNLATENLGQAQLDLGWSTLYENTRHNRANEGIGYMNAQAALSQAGAAWANAAANTMNAQTNRDRLGWDRVMGTYEMGYKSAQITNQREANEISRMQAETARQNAYINQQNADTNRANAWIHGADVAGDYFTDIQGNFTDQISNVVKIIPFIGG